MTHHPTLPPAHWKLWTDKRLVVQLAVSNHYIRGVGLHHLLAVVGHDDTLTGQVMSRFFKRWVVEHQNDVVVAVLVGDPMWRFCGNIPSVVRHVERIPMNAFPLVTAPAGQLPGVSAVTVRSPLEPCDNSSPGARMGPEP